MWSPFVCIQPSSMAIPSSSLPLAKAQKDNPALADRFELFINHQEVANCYVEQNDPIAQSRAFNKEKFEGGMLVEEDEGMGEGCANEEFVKVLMAGMPPTVGCGVGIDRLVMLLMGGRHIRDVILFPTLQQQ